MDGSVVNNRSDCFRPLRIGLWDPFQMACLWLLHGGLLTTYDLQVVCYRLDLTPYSPNILLGPKMEESSHGYAVWM